MVDRACVRSYGSTTQSRLWPTTGAAKKGLAALVIEWDDGPHAKLNTGDILRELEKATLNSGPVAQSMGNIDNGMTSTVTKIEATYQFRFSRTRRWSR